MKRGKLQSAQSAGEKRRRLLNERAAGAAVRTVESAAQKLDRAKHVGSSFLLTHSGANEALELTITL